MPALPKSFKLVKRYWCFLGLFIFSLSTVTKAVAQTPKLKALIDQLKKENSGEKQLQTIVSICARNYSLSDSVLLKYILQGEKLALPLSLEYFRIEIVKCIFYGRTGRFDEAINFIDSLMKIIPVDKSFSDVRLRLINVKITTFIRKGQSKEAIENSFLLLQEAERAKDTIRILSAYAIMGWANMELENFNDAIKWLNKGINFTNDTNMLNQASYLYSNIASCYNNIGKPDSAFYFINLALKCTRADENLTGIANALNIRADMYIKQKNILAAEQDMQEAIMTREQIGDVIFVISDMAQLSSFYASTNQTEKGIYIAQKGIDIAQKRNNLSKLIFLYNALAENYKKANNKDQYSATLLQIINLKDSLYQKNSEQAIADMEAKYEVAKKEKIIIQQNLTLTKRNYIYYGSLAFFILTGIITLLVFNQYRQKQKRIEAQAVASAKEDERKRIAAELHDNIGTQLSYISRKIEFESSSSIPADSQQHKFLRDISVAAQKTSLDLRETIWALKKEEINLNELADRIKIFASQQQSSHPFINLLITENLSSAVSFTSIESLNIFRICQEAIYNAFQHSRAMQIQLEFMSDNKKNWMISISDNGKGFDPEQEYINHYGIENMQQRAKEIKTKIELKSVATIGTTISLFKF